GIRDFHVTGVQTCALPIFKNAIRSTISINSLPGLIPLTTEVDACHAANYRYFHEWQELAPEQQAFLIGHYLSSTMKENIQKDERSEERRVGKECRSK